MVRHGLIVTYFFPPGGGGGVQRWTKFIKYLSRQDWQFTVITNKQSITENSDSTLLKDIPNTTRVIQVSDKFSKHHNKFKSNYFRRWLVSFFFVMDSRKYWVKKAWNKIVDELSQTKYDFVICSIPPYSVSELAIRAKENFKNLPVILDMRDPWSINPYKIYPTPIHKYLDRQKELSTIKKLDYLISAYKSTVNFYAEKITNFDVKQSIVISNGFDEEDFNNLKSIKLPNPDYLNLAFSGTFYSHLNNPQMLFKSLSILKEEGFQINFHHIGTSVFDLEQLAKKYGIEEIIVNWGYRNHKECLEILNEMDVLTVILDSRKKYSGNTIGGKVYEYLGLKKPILALVTAGGEAAQLISDTRSGLICDSKNASEIAQAIKDIESNKFEHIEIEQFSRENLANKLNDFLTNIK